MAAITFLEAIRQAMQEEMRRDERVLLMGEDVANYGGAFKVTQGMFEEFGRERVVDTPIAESAIVGAAIGMSMNGLLPIVEMQFIDFITCAFDQITSYAAKSRYRWGVGVPIVIRGPSSGNVHGGPFHSAKPGDVLRAHAGAQGGGRRPRRTTPRDSSRPPSATRTRCSTSSTSTSTGASRTRCRRMTTSCPSARACVRKQGKDITVVTYGTMLYVALEAAQQLERDGISLEVIDLRSLLPFDEDMVMTSVKKTGRLILLHEDTLTGGLGGEIAARVADQAFLYLEAPIKRVTAPDTPVPFAPPLEEFFLPKSSDVNRVARELMAF